MKLASLAGTLALLVATAPVFSAGGTHSVLVFDVPGATDTIGLGINNRGVVVGAATPDEFNTSTGFIKHGASYSLVSVPGSDYSELGAINDQGETTADAFTPDFSELHGYLGSRSGLITPLPFAVLDELINLPLGINNRGVVVGVYGNDPSFDESTGHGYLFSDGSYTFYDVPGSLGTQLNGINDHGDIVGRYYDAVAAPHGFVRTQHGLAPVAFPGATATFPFGINNRGEIVGFYRAGNQNHGFLLSGGVFTTVDAPGYTGVKIYGLNDVGNLVGQAVDAQHHFHGLLISRRGPK